MLIRGEGVQKSQKSSDIKCEHSPDGGQHISGVASVTSLRGGGQKGVVAYEAHLAVKWPNAVLCKRMRSAIDKSEIDNDCMQKHNREIIFTLSILGLGLGK